MIEQKQATMKDLGVIPLSKWEEYYTYPSINSLRWYISSKKKGFDECYHKVGTTIYIKIDALSEWLKGNM